MSFRKIGRTEKVKGIRFGKTIVHISYFYIILKKKRGTKFDKTKII